LLSFSIKIKFQMEAKLNENVTSNDDVSTIFPPTPTTRPSFVARWNEVDPEKEKRKCKRKCFLDKNSTMSQITYAYFYLCGHGLNTFLKNFLKIELHSCEHARQRHPWFRLLSAVLLVTRQFVDGHDTCRDNTVLAVA
jgi:hypothetical protein